MRLGGGSQEKRARVTGRGEEGRRADGGGSGKRQWQEELEALPGQLEV